MYLRLNLDDVDVRLKISGWLPEQHPDNDWCDTELSLQSEYLHYSPHHELIMHIELTELRDVLKKLLNGTLSKDTHITFAEPDLEFMLHTAKRCYAASYKKGFCDYDIEMDWIIRFWSSQGLGANLFRMTLERQEIHALYVYLCCATQQLQPDSGVIQQMAEQGYILPD